MSILAPEGGDLTIADLNVWYGASQVLHGVGLTVKPGLVMAIVGRNGVGKTTLVNAAMGLIPATGSVQFGGTELLGKPAASRRSDGFALVPQGRRVFRSLTVAEHLTLVPEDQDSRFSVEWVYETFPRLCERRTSLAHTLSGGEQSMLAVGRALTANPRVLLMDEPTEGLAPLLIQRVAETIALVRDMGVTTIVVEQNLRFALDVANSVAIMQRGSISQTLPRTGIEDIESLSQAILVGS